MRLLLCLVLCLGLGRAQHTITLSSGETRSFASEIDLSTGGRTLRLLYTLLADGSLTGALQASVGSGEYAGFSFGRAHRRDSPTVIATTEFVDGYYLPNYSVSTCNSARGTWPLTGASLEYDGANGLLTALFSGSGVSSGDTAIGYAVGPYTGGVLGDHTRGGYPYGDVRATLEVSAPPAVASPAPETPGATTGPSQPRESAPGGSPPPRSPSPTPAAVAPAGSAGWSLSGWVADTAAGNWRLMMAFVASCLAAPGAALLLWPFLFDAAVDVCSLCRCWRQ